MTDPRQTLFSVLPAAFVHAMCMYTNAVSVSAHLLSFDAKKVGATGYNGKGGGKPGTGSPHDTSHMHYVLLTLYRHRQVLSLKRRVGAQPHPCMFCTLHDTYTYYFREAR